MRPILRLPTKDDISNGDGGGGCIGDGGSGFARSTDNVVDGGTTL